MQNRRPGENLPHHRVILHCDMNNCFASIEIKLNPELKGKPVAVCGSQKERHGIVLAKSEEAKRYGVKTAEVIWQAKQKCPDLIIVPPHFEEYRKYSLAAKKIYMEYTDLVEPFGLDECWLDVTGSQLLFGTGEEIAYEIKERIKRELGITVSIGVSFNKVYAKLGSDLKKPDAVSVIPAVSYPQIVFPLPASDLLGVGRKTAAKLNDLGIHTIGELAATDKQRLIRWFGKMGEVLWRNANGLDQSEVKRFDYVEPPKSIGRGTTCPADLYGKEAVWQVLYRLSDAVAMQLHQQNMIAGGVQLTVRNPLLVDKQAQKTCTLPISSAIEIAKAALSLFESIYRYSQPVRALTVRVFALMDAAAPEQMLFGEDVARRQKSERKEQAVFALRQKFGKNAVSAACLVPPQPKHTENQPENA